MTGCFCFCHAEKVFMPTLETPENIDPIRQEPIVPLENQPKNTNYRPLLFILGAVVIILLAVVATLFFVSKKSLPQYITQYTAQPTASPQIATTISGQVLFEGYMPPNAYVAIGKRNEGNGQYEDVVSGLIPQNSAVTWHWTGATAGTNYDLIAELKVQGKTLETSPLQSVSAPATNVSLTLVSTQKPPAAVSAAMSGQVNVDGYIPSGATLTIFAMKEGASSFQTVASGITAIDNANWSWTGATDGTTYQVKAQLISNGQVISTGDTQTVTAPSSGELLNVTSTATAPVPVTSAPVAAGIFGTITINGNMPSGANITLATRPTGTGTFNQVISTISATNGVNFAWNNGVAGRQYDVQAYLWSNGKPYAASNVITVTTPSTNNILTINAQQSLQAPSSGTITVSCGGSSNNLAQATINFNTQGNLPNAASFNVVSILASQNSQVMNAIVSPSNANASQSMTTAYIFQPGVTYYAQYAYATSVGGQFSPMSPSIQFVCQ